MLASSLIDLRTPYLMMIIYSLSTGLPAPSAWDSTGKFCFTSACVFAVTNSAINPLLLVTLDSRIRSNVFEMFGIDAK